MRIKGGFGWDHRDLSTEHTEDTLNNPRSTRRTRIFWVAYGKMFWSSESRGKARFHYAES